MSDPVIVVGGGHNGLYTAGAGSAPMGGVAGTPGKAAALRLLARRQ